MAAPLITVSLSIVGTTSTAWGVTRLVAREAVSHGYRVEVVAAPPQAVDPIELIGLEAVVIVQVDGEDQHCFHGVVLEASESALADEFVVEVTVGARVELLRLGRGSRTFQDKSIQDVVTEVFAEAGLSDQCEWCTNTTYEPHEYIVQYNESDYDFVRRLLQEEGIGFVVQNDLDAEKVIFFDDDTAFQAITGDSQLTRNESLEGGLREVQDHRVVASDKVMLRDYDLKHAGADLSTSAETAESTQREHYLHPGGFVDSGRGQRLTDRLLERLQVGTRVLRGRSDAPRLEAGRFFTLAGSARAEANTDYLLLEITHRYDARRDGAASDHWGYQNEFVSIPLDVRYRPAGAVESGCVPGPQPALVTVPGGEEIHSDELGRVKVRFLWDRAGVMDDKSSTWLRVGQLALGGSMVLPRVDFEVLVDFEMSDRDRPVVSGHVYNAEAGPPYPLPGSITRSSVQTATTGGGPGANELRFEDAAGAEEIFINASKDLIVSVDNDTNWSVGVNQVSDIGGNNVVSVATDNRASVSGSRSLSIGANQSHNVAANFSDSVGGSLDIDIGGNRMLTVGGDHTEESAATLTRTVGSLQCITGIAGVARNIVGDSATTVGTAWAELAGGSRGLSIAGSYTETVGALKFIKAKQVSVTCDSAYTMNAAAELVKAGGSRTDEALGAVALTAGGVFKVKAKNIVFEAKSKLVFRGGGGVIELTKAGTVKIKAPSITVKNAKALKQIMHKSN